MKVLLINPPSYDQIYRRSRYRAVRGRAHVPLGLCCIAAPVLEGGHGVEILDLNVISVGDAFGSTYNYDFDAVGFTATTPLFPRTSEIAALFGSAYHNRPVVVLGGYHASALDAEVARLKQFDSFVQGEGDYALADIVRAAQAGHVSDVYVRPPQKNLDSLPFPAYGLLDIPRYKLPAVIARRNPVAQMETSRGCPHSCTFCNRRIQGFEYRAKSPERVVEEMQRILGLGFREIHIVDDNFSADELRVYQICELILEKGLDFTWCPRSGLRADAVSPELLRIMKRAGCYRVPFGVESGSQQILNSVGKRIELFRVMKAFEWAKQSGLETEAFFMMGLPGETAETLHQSVNCAIRLDPDYVKFSTFIPMPGSFLFDRMRRKGQIKSYDWSKYNIAASGRDVYDHDVLDWDLIEEYLKLAHLKFYFRPKYLLRMITKTLRTRSFWQHVKAAVRTKWV